jgi:O-methyltransferase
VFGLEIGRKKSITEFPIELSKPEQDLVKLIFDKQYSMTTINNLFATALACKYIINNGINGDFVECGTYRGGHALLAAGIFKLHNQTRKVWIYDTFEGMTQPEEIDVEVKTGLIAAHFYELNRKDSITNWCYASEQEVRNNFKEMDLLNDNIRLIKGDVCLTLLNSAKLPNKISILRLDTDWYSSTKVELEVLYPLLTHSGILIVDDYGWWAGSKLATDEYFKNNVVFMNYIDQGARIWVKN